MNLEQHEPRDERQHEREQIRTKLESERRRRQAMRAAMLRSPAERQAEIDACAASAGVPASPELSSDENLVSHEGRTLREALTWECARASELLDVPLPVAPTSLAVAILSSHDYAYGVDLEHLPIHAVSFGRIFGHLGAVGLAIDPWLAASIVRRTMRLLLNASHLRAAAATKAQEPLPEVAVTLAPVPEPGAAYLEVDLSAQEPEPEPEPVVRATPGRRVIGRVRVVAEVQFANMTIPVGEVLDEVEPSRRDAEDLEAFATRGTPHMLVWWQGMSRFVRCDEVERVVGGEA